jgi:hypothetical protein
MFHYIKIRNLKLTQKINFKKDKWNTLKNKCVKEKDSHI